jgi:hypothetical protein
LKYWYAEESADTRNLILQLWEEIGEEKRRKHLRWHIGGFGGIESGKDETQ